MQRRCTDFLECTESFLARCLQRCKLEDQLEGSLQEKEREINLFGRVRHGLQILSRRQDSRLDSVLSPLILQDIGLRSRWVCSLLAI